MTSISRPVNRIRFKAISALGYVTAARRALEGPVDGASTDALLDIADAVVDRYA